MADRKKWPQVHPEYADLCIEYLTRLHGKLSANGTPVHAVLLHLHIIQAAVTNSAADGLSGVAIPPSTMVFLMQLEEMANA